MQGVATLPTLQDRWLSKEIITFVVYPACVRTMNEVWFFVSYLFFLIRRRCLNIIYVYFLVCWIFEFWKFRYRDVSFCVNTVFNELSYVWIKVSEKISYMIITNEDSLFSFVFIVTDPAKVAVTCLYVLLVFMFWTSSFIHAFINDTCGTRVSCDCNR